MVDKIFKWMSYVTDGIADKKYGNFFKENRNKIFVWFLVFLFVSSGISTYVEGECINCVELNDKEVEMLFEKDQDGTRLMKFLENREYKPITKVSTFFKLWFIKFTPSATLFSLFYFGIAFTGMLVSKLWVNYLDKQKNIYKNKLKQK